MLTQETSVARITERRFTLHESAADGLRAGKYSEAARWIRRLLMTLPPDHSARRDLLTVLAFAESQS